MARFDLPRKNGLTRSDNIMIVMITDWKLDERVTFRILSEYFALRAEYKTDEQAYAILRKRYMESAGEA